MLSAVRFAAPLCCLLALACSEQGEGERCDLRNNNNDCESGLECVALESLGVNSAGAVCCPARGSSGAQNPICQRRGDFDDPPSVPPPSMTPEAGAESPSASDSGTPTDTADAALERDAASSDTGTASSGEAGLSEAGLSEAGLSEAGAEPAGDAAD